MGRGDYMNTTYYCLEKNCKKQVWKQGNRCKSCSQKGDRNSFFRKQHSKKSLEKMSGDKHWNYKDGKSIIQNNCIDCGEEVWYSSKRCSVCSHEGNKNGRFVHGMSYTPYSEEFNKQLKEKIRKRDNYTCQCCGILEKNHYRKLDIHHIDYDKHNCDEKNLISNCKSCHSKTNSNRDYWFAYYTYIMEKLKNDT